MMVHDESDLADPLVGLAQPHREPSLASPGALGLFAVHRRGMII
jgi:hypothetical protein